MCRCWSRSYSNIFSALLIKVSRLKSTVIVDDLRVAPGYAYACVEVPGYTCADPE